MTAPALEIRGSGSFAIYRGTLAVAGPYVGQKAAITALRGVERRLTPATTRPCLNCATPFKSTGKGHRLCQGCRGLA